jgi:hypothetical protein
MVIILSKFFFLLFSRLASIFKTEHAWFLFHFFLTFTNFFRFASLCLVFNFYYKFIISSHFMQFYLSIILICFHLNLLLLTLSFLPTIRSYFSNYSRLGSPVFLSF